MKGQETAVPSSRADAMTSTGGLVGSERLLTGASMIWQLEPGYDGSVPFLPVPALSVLASTAFGHSDFQPQDLTALRERNTTCCHCWRAHCLPGPSGTVGSLLAVPLLCV